MNMKPLVNPHLKSQPVPQPDPATPPISQTLQGLIPSASAELMAYARSKPGTLHLSQGQGTRQTPDFICQAVQDSLTIGETFYGPSLGRPELRDELSAYYKRIFDCDIPANRIFCTPSGSNAMHMALTSILEEGDDIVAITPIWKNLLGAVQLARGNIIEVPLDCEKEDGWIIDLDRLFDAVTPSTKALLITTPSNPTGWTMDAEQIQKVVQFSRDNNIWIISDEVYARCMYGRTHAPSFLEHTDENDLLLTVNSFSKSWAMTGWRLGWIVGPAFMEETIEKIAMYENLCLPPFTQAGAIVALRDGEPFLREQMQHWQSNRDLMMERLASREAITIHAPQSAFYGFFKIEEVSENDVAFCRRLIDEAALSLAPGSCFGQGGKGFIRINFAVDQEKFTEALDRLEDFV